MQQKYNHVQLGRGAGSTQSDSLLDSAALLLHILSDLLTGARPVSEQHIPLQQSCVCMFFMHRRRLYSHIWSHDCT